MSKRKISVQGVIISLDNSDKEDFVSLSDIAKNFGKPANIIRNWLRNNSTLGYLNEWELLHNPNFNQNGFDYIIKQSVTQGNSFALSPKLWIEKTNCIGLKSNAGRYGGTYAHNELAMNFCYWLNPKFQIYFIKEFKRLKEKEQTNWLKEAKFFIDRNENYTLEANRFARDMQKMIDEKMKDNQ